MTQKKKYLPGIAFLLPSFLGVFIFVLLPFADVVRRSFLTAVDESWVGFKNYITVFNNAAFKLAAGNTVRFVAICLPLLIFISLLIAYLLYKKIKNTQFFKTAFLLPMAIPTASVVLLWKVLFNSKGLLNAVLNSFNIETVDWMNSKYAFWVLIVVYIWKNLGYTIVLWLAGLSSISEDIYEAARVDGAGEWKMFWRITLPSLMPVLYTITVLSFLNSFKVFREAYLVAGDYPHDSMYLLQHIFNNWFRDLAVDKMAAGAVVVAVVILVLILMLQKAWDKED